MSENMIKDPGAIFRSLYGAIEQLKPVLFLYKDKSRFVFPFMLGRTKDNRTVLQAYQDTVFEAPDLKAQKVPGWRFFYVDEIQHLMVAPNADPSGFKAAFVDQPLVKAEAPKPPAFVSQVLAQVVLP